jgi:hypothetical protein
MKEIIIYNCIPERLKRVMDKKKQKAESEKLPEE